MNGEGFAHGFSRGQERQNTQTGGRADHEFWSPTRPPHVLLPSLRSGYILEHMERQSDRHFVPTLAHSAVHEADGYAAALATPQTWSAMQPPHQVWTMQPHPWCTPDQALMQQPAATPTNAEQEQVASKTVLQRLMQKYTSATAPKQRNMSSQQDTSQSDKPFHNKINMHHQAKLDGFNTRTIQNHVQLPEISLSELSLSPPLPVPRLAPVAASKSWQTGLHIMASPDAVLPASPEHDRRDSNLHSFDDSLRTEHSHHEVGNLMQAAPVYRVPQQCRTKHGANLEWPAPRHALDGNTLREPSFVPAETYQHYIHQTADFALSSGEWRNLVVNADGSYQKIEPWTPEWIQSRGYIRAWLTCQTLGDEDLRAVKELSGVRQHTFYNEITVTRQKNLRDPPKTRRGRCLRWADEDFSAKPVNLPGTPPTHARYFTERSPSALSMQPDGFAPDIGAIGGHGLLHRWNTGITSDEQSGSIVDDDKLAVSCGRQSQHANERQQYDRHKHNSHTKLSAGSKDVPSSSSMSESSNVYGVLSSAAVRCRVGFKAGELDAINCHVGPFELKRAGSVSTGPPASVDASVGDAGNHFHGYTGVQVSLPNLGTMPSVGSEQWKDGNAAIPADSRNSLRHLGCDDSSRLRVPSSILQTKVEYDRQHHHRLARPWAWDRQESSARNLSRARLDLSLLDADDSAGLESDILLRASGQDRLDSTTIRPSV